MFVQNLKKVRYIHFRSSDMLFVLKIVGSFPSVQCTNETFRLLHTSTYTQSVSKRRIIWVTRETEEANIFQKSNEIDSSIRLRFPIVLLHFTDSMTKSPPFSSPFGTKALEMCTFYFTICFGFSVFFTLICPHKTKKYFEVMNT